MKINFLMTVKRLYKHATTYVYTYDVRNDLIAQITGKSYYASGSGMNIRHDADLAVAEYIY